MGDAWRQATIQALHAYLRDRIAAVIGDDHPELDVRAQTGPSVLLYQGAICAEELDAEGLADHLSALIFSAT